MKTIVYLGIFFAGCCFGCASLLTVFIVLGLSRQIATAPPPMLPRPPTETPVFIVVTITPLPTSIPLNTIAIIPNPTITPTPLLTLASEPTFTATFVPTPTSTTIESPIPTATQLATFTPMPTETLTPMPISTIPICSSDVYNCPDFGTHAEAQGVFEYCRDIGAGDIHGLDGDNDGSVCEDRP